VTTTPTGGTDSHAGTGKPLAEARTTIVLYSDDATTRARVRAAIGRRPATGLPLIEWIECATAPAVLSRLDAGGIDLAIFDGEAAPLGGMGLCRQVKDEVYRCPPVLLLTGRAQDNWLATWSRADAAVAHPLDPMILARTVAELVRERQGGLARSTT
jgi:DNA-binding response OmpR family regulator